MLTKNSCPVCGVVCVYSHREGVPIKKCPVSTCPMHLRWLKYEDFNIEAYDYFIKNYDWNVLAKEKGGRFERFRVECLECGAGGASSRPCYCYQCEERVMMFPVLFVKVGLWSEVK